MQAPQFGLKETYHMQCVCVCLLSILGMSLKAFLNNDANSVVHVACQNSVVSIGVTHRLSFYFSDSSPVLASI